MELSVEVSALGVQISGREIVAPPPPWRISRRGGGGPGGEIVEGGDVSERRDD